MYLLENYLMAVLILGEEKIAYTKASNFGLEKYQDNFDTVVKKASSFPSPLCCVTH